MKKLSILLTAALFLSGLCFAGGGDKGKDKKKKPPMTNCPGKQCGKKTTTPVPPPAKA